jgi:hypothetical protein
VIECRRAFGHVGFFFSKFTLKATNRRVTVHSKHSYLSMNITLQKVIMMSNTMKNRIANARNVVAGADHKIAVGAKKVADLVMHETADGPAKDSDALIAGIEERTSVIAESDSPDDQHHLIPVGWIERLAMYT